MLVFGLRNQTTGFGGTTSMRHMPTRIFACVALLAAHTAIASPGCRTISGFEQYLSQARGVVVGDLHGTVEAPAFVASLVCNLAHSGHPVVLGLEYPVGEQHYLDEFLRAPTDNPQPALLSSPFWNRSMQDGRTSRAMFDLLGSVRQQLRDGARIRVVAFDAPPPSALSGTPAFDARDKAMADRLRHELSNLSSGEIPVIFAGNVHARKTKAFQAVNAPPGMENAEPLGYRIRDLQFLHLDIGYRGGSLWTCDSPTHCGVQVIGDSRPAVASYSILPSENRAYDAEYYVGTVNASPPAVKAK